MKILFISPSIPSKLHRMRTFQILKTLGENHEVHLVSLDTSNGGGMIPDELVSSLASYKIIHKSKWRSLLDCIFGLFSFLPLEAVYCRSKLVSTEILKMVRENNFDLIYVKRLRSFQFLQPLIGQVPVMIDTTDAMSLFYRRASVSVQWYLKPLYYEEYLKYFLYEKKLAKQKVFNIKKWIACSEVDAKYLRTVSGIKDIEIVPNIVDTDYYNSANLDLSAAGSVIKDYKVEKRSIMISGLMDKFVNTEAVDSLVKEILPIVRKTYSDVKLYIVGPKPTARIRSYENNNVVVTGYVKDLREYIMKAEIVVCTVKTGTGTRFKILQALAMNKPVVSTTAGFEGLEGENGRELLIADDVEGFAQDIIRLFESNDLKERIGKVGREMVESKYSRKALKDSLEKALTL